MTTTKDICWLAGLLEGEGCFTADHGNPRVFVKMNDEDVMSRALRIMKPTQFRVNGNSVRQFTDKSRLGSKQPFFVAAIYGGRAAGWMMTVYSFMGLRRQARIREILIKWQADKKGRIYGLKGAV